MLELSNDNFTHDQMTGKVKLLIDYNCQLWNEPMIRSDVVYLDRLEVETHKRKRRGEQVFGGIFIDTYAILKET